MMQDVRSRCRHRRLDVEKLVGGLIPSYLVPKIECVVMGENQKSI